MVLQDSSLLTRTTDRKRWLLDERRPQHLANHQPLMKRAGNAAFEISQARLQQLGGAADVADAREVAERRDVCRRLQGRATAATTLPLYREAEHLPREKNEASGRRDALRCVGLNASEV